MRQFERNLNHIEHSENKLKHIVYVCFTYCALLCLMWFKLLKLTRYPILAV